MSDELQLTLVQANPEWENITNNIRYFDKLLEKSGNTDIIVLPEMFTTGFSMNAENLATKSYNEGLRFMAKTAKAKNCAITGSLMCFDHGNYYNRLVWMNPDGSMEIYDKRHLFGPGRENQYYTAGIKLLTIEYNGWKIRPLICYDLRFPVWSRNQKHSPYDLLIYVANWPEQRIKHWNILIEARAIENSAYVAGVNRIGNDPMGLHYNGLSALSDFRGSSHILKENEEVVQTFTLDKKLLENYRKQFPVLTDADDFILGPSIN